MKSPCKPVLAAIVTTLLITMFSLQGYAAFPVKASPPKTAAAPPAEENATQEKQQAKHNTLIEKLQKNIHQESSDQERTDHITSVLSFIMGMAGMASLTAALAFSTIGFAVILPIAFGIAAIILGAVSVHRHRRHKGFGIAGLVLGIIDASIGVAILGIIILIAHILGGMTVI